MPVVKHAVVAAIFALAPLFADAQDGGAPPAQAGAEQARVLADMLKDETARAALIKRLEEVAAGGDAGAAAAPAEDGGFAHVLAQRSKDVAERLASVATATTRAVMDVGRAFDGDTDQVLDRTLAVARDLAMVVLITLVSFFVLRILARGVHGRLERRAEGAGWFQRTALLLVSLAVDAAVAAIAWAGGYGFAVGFGEVGTVDVLQTLFLNAFLAIELVKVGLRALLAPRRAGLRMLPMGDETAVYWAFWVGRLVSLLGYGLLMIAPIVSARVSPAAGSALGVLVALTALVMAVTIVLQNRTRVRDVVLKLAGRQHGRLETALLRVLASTWHVAACVYVVALFALWAMRPDDGPRWMLWASLQSVVAIVLGVLVMGFIARWVSAGIRVPEDVRDRLPLLEQRLNAYVPTILAVVRLMVLAGVAAAVAHIWGAVDFLGWVQNETGRETLLRIFSAFLIAVVAVAVYLGVASWVEYRLNPNFGTTPTNRERTLLALFRNAFSIALVIITSMLVLAQLGVNIGPLLAGAGVLGLAIGFGAQKLVQDVITGAFIQFENAMNEGDVVTIAGITGKVERLSVRSVGLRDLNGCYHLIPFSSADSVSNYMKGFSFHVAEIGVAYRENVADVKVLMQEAFDRLRETEHGANLMEDLEMHGLNQFGDSAVMVRARLKCLPGTQWAVGRAYNEIIKEIFDERGVEIPFPHVTLYMGEDKQGRAPPLHVASEGSSGSVAGDAPATA